MRSRATKLITAAITAAALHHPATADTVVLANGDTLTGEVVSQAPQGKVVLEHAQLGRVELPAANVKQVRIDTPTPGDVPRAGEPIDAPGGIAMPASQPAPAQPDKQQATQAAAAQAAKQQDTSAFDLFLNEWDTKLALGFTGTSGNSDRQNYHAKLDTEHQKNDLRWTVNLGWFYATSNNQRTQNETQARITRDWLQKNRPWFFFIRGEHEYDQFRTWENRTSAYGGAGYTFIDDSAIDLKGRMGFGGSYEFGQINEFTPEALFGGSVAKWQINDRQTLSGEMIYYPSLEDDSVFRVQSKLEWLYKLDVASGLSLKLGLQNEYESNTPGDEHNNDLKYYGALVLEF